MVLLRSQFNRLLLPLSRRFQVADRRIRQSQRVDGPEVRPIAQFAGFRGVRNRLIGVEVRGFSRSLVRVLLCVADAK